MSIVYSGQRLEDSQRIIAEKDVPPHYHAVQQDKSIHAKPQGNQLQFGAQPQESHSSEYARRRWYLSVDHPFVLDSI
jgi:hypothetical protein